MPHCSSLLRLLVLFWWAFPVLALASSLARPPNIIFVLADDLGYGDLGCYGQRKIQTPNLDRIASEGMRFTQHYSGNAVCAPSRCVLLTGMHPGHAAIRDNREIKPEGQLPLPPGTLTFPCFLRSIGDATGAFGKWGLGPPGSSGDPLHQGFYRFYGYNCQRMAHNHYPENLWDNELRVSLGNNPFSPHQQLPPAAAVSDPRVYESFKGRHYAPDLITEQALAFIRTNRSKPFFLFYPTTIPHLALQVPEDSLAMYAGNWLEEPYTGNRSYLPHPTPRGAYAAMISRMDREIGRMMELVRSLGLDADTIFVFTSDNGPLYDRLGGTDSDFFDSAAGLRGRKGSLYEGGIRVPLIVRWPGRVKPGAVCQHVTGFEDWLPTLMDLVGAHHLIPSAIDGVSFAPQLRGEAQPSRQFLYREVPGYGGQQSIRVDHWKAIRLNLQTCGNSPTELYDLRVDPGESHDIACEHPKLVRRLENLMRVQHAPSISFPIPALDALSPYRK